MQTVAEKNWEINEVRSMQHIAVYWEYSQKSISVHQNLCPPPNWGNPPPPKIMTAPLFFQVICGLWIFMDWGMTFASIYTLVAISIDRYWAACYSVHYKLHNTRRRTIFIILLVWYAINSKGGGSLLCSRSYLHIYILLNSTIMLGGGLLPYISGYFNRSGYWAASYSVHYKLHNTRRRTISIILLVWYAITSQGEYFQ